MKFANRFSCIQSFLTHYNEMANICNYLSYNLPEIVYFARNKTSKPTLLRHENAP